MLGLKLKHVSKRSPICVHSSLWTYLSGVYVILHKSSWGLCIGISDIVPWVVGMVGIMVIMLIVFIVMLRWVRNSGIIEPNYIQDKLWLSVSIACKLTVFRYILDQSHKSHNTIVPYPTIHHFRKEMWTFLRCIVAHWTGELWDLWH